MLLLELPIPSELLKKSAVEAVIRLQEQFDLRNKKPVKSSYDGFKWVKAELIEHSFDHLQFAYRNCIFSVMIEIFDPWGSSLTGDQRYWFVDRCRKYKLIPCLYKIEFRVTEPEPVFFLKAYERGNYEYAPLESSWNLYDPLSDQLIDPEQIAGLTPTSMSEWEMQSFAIQVVCEDLEKNGSRIIKYCDILEVDPQIWFEDKDGNANWVVVKHIVSVEDLDYRQWVYLEKKCPEIVHYDGYFAPVLFYSQNTRSFKELNRGDPVIPNYKGLERIYVC